MATPAAEIDIDERLVTALLAEQVPSLAAMPMALADNGWDNIVARVGDEWMVRLPRRTGSAPLIESEQRWLPVLAPSLPLAVPVPWFAGRPERPVPLGMECLPLAAGAAGSRGTTDRPGRDGAGVGFVRRSTPSTRPGRCATQRVSWRGPATACSHRRTMNIHVGDLDRWGRRSCGVGRPQCDARVGRPGTVAARRPAPFEHVDARRSAQRSHRLRRHHQRRPGHRPRGRMDDVPANGARSVPRCGTSPAATRPPTSRSHG